MLTAKTIAHSIKILLFAVVIFPPPIIWTLVSRALIVKVQIAGILYAVGVGNRDIG
jgi:hypothetical protein